MPSAPLSKKRKRGPEPLSRPSPPDHANATLRGGGPSPRTNNHLAQSNGVGRSPSSPDPEARLALLQHTIGAQIGLDIMLKHREFRLIEQEMAKCQAALEQLRRCELIPFPTTSDHPDAMRDVINGTGYTSGSGVSLSEAPWQPPWGISDGPYARHYARWLLPDTSFDGPGAIEHLGQGKGVADGRARSGVGDGGLTANKTRPHRGSAAGKLHALSSGYAQPKDKSSPLVVKRSSDNQWVKLICVDCDRGDFSSAQGFINHCRIAHHRGFESHDAAAAVCGQPVELDEHGGVIGAEDRHSGGGPGLVHPLIRSATEGQPSVLPPPGPPGPLSISSPAKPTLQKPLRRKRSNSKKGGSLPPLFVPCGGTPHLSTFMKHKGTELDLSTLVSDTRQSIDWPSSSSSEDESAPPTRTTPNAPPSAPAPRAGMSPAPLSVRPPSSKSHDKNKPPVARTHPGLSSISPRLSQTPAPTAPRTRHPHIPTKPVSPPNSSTPSPTSADQTAPSLVSDSDGEEEYSVASPETSEEGDADEAEAEEAGSAEKEEDDEEESSSAEVASSEDEEGGDEEEVEVEEAGEEDEEEEEATESASSAEDEDANDEEKETEAPRVPTPPPLSHRRTALRAPGASPRKGASLRHVSFSAPHPAEPAPRRPGAPRGRGKAKRGGSRMAVGLGLNGAGGTVGRRRARVGIGTASTKGRGRR
ncbi:MAG: hypothetical protein M1814_001679 [Vezdaea aestivalis]|nr:MAG: hypothetical protein M1814_001679 [Vezdaea aestivalis]